MKKVTVIGRGLVGCTAVSHFTRFTNWQVDWIFDPNVNPVPVGEGSTLNLPRLLTNNLNINFHDTDTVNSTAKLGIWKRGWGKSGTDFKHAFPVGNVGIHFNAIQLQNYLFDILTKNPKVSVIEKCVKDIENIDSDFIMVCAGTPTKEQLDDDYYIRQGISVNACLVMQCPWEIPKFNYSLTFARKYGWVFGIPLKNRCSIGYVYNDKFASVDDVIKDCK